MNENTIGFIGAGNMASSLVSGLIDGGFPREKICVSDIDAEKLTFLQHKCQVNTYPENKSVATRVDVLVLAVKPQILRNVAKEISNVVCSQKPLIISIAAGIREMDISNWLGYSAAIVRCMPNTPALLRTGATALHANPNVSDEQRDLAESVMRAVGLTVWVPDESLLNAVTALSGSGPAYFFLLMELMEKAALDLGLDKETARLLTEQTAFGASKVALEVNESPAELRRRVTSPGGTTQRAIEVFEQGKLELLVAKAMRAAQARSIEMSTELGGEQ